MHLTQARAVPKGLGFVFFSMDLVTPVSKSQLLYLYVATTSLFLQTEKQQKIKDELCCEITESDTEVNPITHPGHMKHIRLKQNVVTSAACFYVILLVEKCI